ncbi:MAG: ATP-binding cassette domain-containing protein [Anaerolineae bacterium]|nr:ATP-binding cassette domain-containing protein [Anaerolineae bacterium]
MSIILENLSKRYEGHPVVNQVSLEIADGEFFVLLGSSGSGKTTVLSIIAGLVSTEQGRVILHGRDVTYLPTQQRNVGYVFQHYALFQHMTVADNIEFGLRVRKMPAAARQQRRDELLELVGLTGLGSRMPRQISGGQQQRVALARALAHRPDVLLLDEPLGALDAKIRTELRRTLKTIQRELGITTILVTHDQEEAFELADRLGVMSFGRLLEVGPPDQLYRRPQSEFVATFLGTANLLVGEAAYNGIQVGPRHFDLDSQALPVEEGQRVQVLIRPEDVALAVAADQLDCPPLGQGIVEHTVFSGSFERSRLRLPALPGVRPIAPPPAYGDDAILIEVTRTQDQVSRLPIQPEQKVWVGVRRLHALAHPGLRFLMPTDGSPLAEAALAYGGHLARMAHARVTLLAYGMDAAAGQKHLQACKEKLGGGLVALDLRQTEKPLAAGLAEEVERQPVDLVFLGFAPHAPQFRLAEAILPLGEHHLLLVPPGAAAPSQVLVCVASGEPGKEDIRFTARLVRHVGAEAAVLAVISSPQTNETTRQRVDRFLSQGVKTLELLGVPAETVIRTGPVSQEIQQQIAAAPYDLLVFGSPLPDKSGEISLDGVISQVLTAVPHLPTLIVRSAGPERADTVGTLYAVQEVF